MFEKLFTRRIVLYRHESAPYRKERELYLEYCEQQGYTISTLLHLARELLWIARKLHIYPERGVYLKQVEAAAQGWAKRRHFSGQALNTRWTRIRFIQVARSWLSFLGYWREPEQSTPFDHLLEEFREWMKNERGFTSQSIQQQCGRLRQFLRWYGSQTADMSAVGLKDVDAFLAYYGAKGNCRASVKSMATTLRAFFKYAGSKEWCSSLISCGILSPRVFAQEQLPMGPSWDEVKRLIANMDTDRPRDIRDKAIVMLFAIYGFRSTEVSTLKLEDIDWEQNIISVTRVKRRGRQIYPLIPIVGNAIIRYLRKVRPQSPFREIFLTLTPAFRPFARGTLYHVTSERMKELGIRSPHVGPHSLRHACATRLIDEGFSLKEIGDHLGHRCSFATRIYAKVNLQSLREVASFDRGGLL